jgi:protection-of-telomeres protein 1
MTSLKIPTGFTTVQAILDGKHHVGTRLSVVGIVTDFRAPRALNPPHDDWKAEVRFFDESVMDDTEASLSLHIFLRQEHIPDFAIGDVIVIVQAKIQHRSMQPISLITHYLTDIHVLPGGKIPSDPSKASKTLVINTKRPGRPLTDSELRYAISAYNATDKSRLPTAQEFETRKVQSTNVVDKFRELKDLQDGRFSDLVVQVVKDPYDLGDKITLWVSDYTENPSFFNQSVSLEAVNGIAHADPYGYGTNGEDAASSHTGWTGPFGKRSLQITCWEPHATAIRNCKISQGSWVAIRNVQIKLGHNYGNLEGYLRGDLNSPLKIGISPLDIRGEPDERFKAAVRRKKDYEKTKKQQLKSIVVAAEAGQKRKADMAEVADGKERRGKFNGNSKTRRQQKRANQKSKQEEKDSAVLSNLNAMVKCENQHKSSSSVSEMLKPVHVDTTVSGQNVRLPLPFVNLNYRLHVRVVDFYPLGLEDFARPVVTSEYDVLSDDEHSDSGSDSDNESRIAATPNGWEWRFFLKLEDATEDSSEPDRVAWVLVDNFAAQCLIDLDASDLRNDMDKVEDLRQRLFLLWGELEECKQREIAKRAILNAYRNGPPPSSDDEGFPQPSTVANVPFSCCVRQYGIKVTERNPAKADAGVDMRWERVFGLFGTRICVPKAGENGGTSG